MFNITRRATSPDSLKKNTWRAPDVAKALSDDFLGKCYLCEIKNPISFNIEHFESRKINLDKQYDWANLFFACARCNNFKGGDAKVIDCTDPGLDVCRLIRHGLPSTPYSKIEIEATSSNALVQETADLLNKIYNLSNTGNRSVSAVSLKREIFKKTYKLLTHIHTYESEDCLPREKELALEHIRDLMSKRHEFSAFLRWIILESPELHELVGDAID